MNNTITTIFFDIGNVLVGFDHQQMWENLASVSLLSAQELQQCIQESGLMRQMETGTITPHDFFLKVQQDGQLDPTLSFQRFKVLWADMFWEQTPMIQLAHTLRQRYKVGLLSTTDAIHWEWLLKQYPIFSQVDEWVLSFEIGYVKPAREIYQAALRCADAQAQQCVYIDDIAHFAETSRKLGIYGIHYQSPEQVFEALRQLNVLP